MLEKRRRRVDPEPEPRRRRTRESSGAGMSVTVPPAESALSGYAEGEKVQIALLVTATVTEGNMHRGDLENWFRSAMHSYHTFRNGFVGLNAQAKITVPYCVRIDKVAD